MVGTRRIAIWVATLTLAALLTPVQAVATPRAAEALAGNCNRVSWLSLADGDTTADLVVADPDGTDRLELDVTAATHAWSPDGSLVAIGGDDGLAISSGRDTVVTPLWDGRVIAHRGAAITWAPDGGHLAWIGVAAGETTTHLWTVRPDGAGLTRLSANELSYQSLWEPGRWGPDGRILWREVRDGTPFSRAFVIRHAEADGSDPVVYDPAVDPDLGFGPDRLNQSAFWSPSGEWVAWLGERTTGSTYQGTLVMVARRDGTDIRVVSADEGGNAHHDLEWSPTRDELTWLVDGRVQLYRTGPDDRRVLAGGATAARWRPDGDAVAVGMPQGSVEVRSRTAVLLDSFTLPPSDAAPGTTLVPRSFTWDPAAPAEGHDRLLVEVERANYLPWFPVVVDLATGTRELVPQGTDPMRWSPEATELFGVEGELAFDTGLYYFDTSHPVVGTGDGAHFAPIDDDRAYATEPTWRPRPADLSLSAGVSPVSATWTPGAAITIVLRARAACPVSGVVVTDAVNPCLRATTASTAQGRIDGYDWHIPFLTGTAELRVTGTVATRGDCRVDATVRRSAPAAPGPVTATTGGVTSIPATCALVPGFDDVAPSSFAAADIGCIRDLGITTGTTATTYSPADLVTREQMAAFLVRLRLVLGARCPTGPQPFADMAPTSYAYDDVICLRRLGITTGVAPDRYGPVGLVTREQIAAFVARLWRSLGGVCDVDGQRFADVPSTSFAYDDVQCLRNLAITTGVSATRFAPTEAVTREQMAALLARLWRAALPLAV